MPNNECIHFIDISVKAIQKEVVMKDCDYGQGINKKPSPKTNY